MGNMLSHQNQIYLLGYWLRNNIISIQQELSHDKPDWNALAAQVNHQLFAEYDITDNAVTKEIIDMWREGMDTEQDELPEFCYGILKTNNTVILIKRGETGYYPFFEGTHKGREVAIELNAKIGVTPAQMMAMEYGSSFGWDIALADPRNYDENGMRKPIDLRDNQGR